MSAIVLDNNFKKKSEIALPERYKDIKEHNLYLYVKSYLASLRANTALAKTRGNVSGGGRKPWAQKGGGRARAGISGRGVCYLWHKALPKKKLFWLIEIYKIAILLIQMR